MPSTSPGHAPETPSEFAQILPGAPNVSLQTIDIFAFRYKRYTVYISGRQANILSSPTSLVQSIKFDDELVATAAESQTGKVAVADSKKIWILRPLTEGWTRVWWEKTLCLSREDADDVSRCLGWGGEGEVLVGGTNQLSLFSTLPSSRTSSPPADGARIEHRKALWSKPIPSPLQYALFSPTAGLIATCGVYDRLVKIWRRLSFEECLFDHTYLPHSAAVTHLEWRPPQQHSEGHRESGMSGRHEEDLEILYTISNDGVLRVWRTSGVHDLDIVVLHTTIDLDSAIPQSPSLAVKGGVSTQPARYCFILSSEQYCDAVTTTIGLRTEKLSHSLEHLKESSAKEPDVIVSFDGHGRMSAWGLQSIGHKRRPGTPSGAPPQPYHIAHAEGLQLRLADSVNARFRAWFDNSTFNILVHAFSGYVQWWQGGVESFFSPATVQSERLREMACWSGHRTSPINVLCGSLSSTSLVSCGHAKDVVQWSSEDDETALHGYSSYVAEGEVLDLALLTATDGESLVALLEKSSTDVCKLELILVGTNGRVLGKRSYVLELADDDTRWSLRACASMNEAETNAIIVSSSNSGRGFATTLEIQPALGVALPVLRSYSLPLPDTDAAMLHIASVLDAEDTGKIGFVGIDDQGNLHLYHIDVSPEVQSFEPILMASFNSGIQHPSILAVSDEFAAVASAEGDELSIVDLREGYVEHHQPSSRSKIEHIVPSAVQKMVAIGYNTHVDVMVQGRYDPHHRLPTWILAKQISVAQIGLTIDAIAWFGNTELAVAAGKGIYVSSGYADIQTLPEDVQEATGAPSERGTECKIPSLTQQLQRPLPVWHPGVVSNILHHGHWSFASDIVHEFNQRLKFWSEGDDLDPFLEMPPEQLYSRANDSRGQTLDEDVISNVLQQLEEKHLPGVSRAEQRRLRRIIQAMRYCREHVGGLDGNALRFLFSWKLELLRMDEDHASQTGLSNGVVPAVPEMHWREIAFAHHSATQQPLLDILVAHYDNKITWNIARRLGLFAWLSDRQALEQIFEALAQSAYRSTSPPDPINASLYFLAQHKKPALLALWRIATWHKEQRATMNFLRRDFSQPENRTAAKKNAYALMGKKRFEYAAAFFLLAGDPGSATSLIASQCDDIMLAIAVARLYSGDGSDVLRKLLQDRVMPQAVSTGDRWKMSWCHSILLERGYATEVLIAPLEGVRTWQQDHPDTLALYRQLRKSESEHEYEAVLRAARILRRMGLWLPALELVSRWNFEPIQSTLPLRDGEVKTNGVHKASQSSDPPSVLDNFLPAAAVARKEPPSMLDGFEEAKPLTNAVQDDKAAREAKAAELLKKLKAKKDTAQPIINEKKPEPTQFKEPDANSLLDSFGF